MILDGWGIGDGSSSDVIASTGTPRIDNIKNRYPSSYLLTSGEDVGLPEGQMGNSEVGHLNIGAGRVVYQDLVKINKACSSGEIRSNKVLKEAFSYALDEGVKVHIMGLLSDGGVHSSDSHFNSFCQMASEYGIKDLFIHGFGDGRDTDPKSGSGYVTSLLRHLEGGSGRLASFIGRYYAMDRDKRWERIKEAYDMLVHGKGTLTSDIAGTIESYYEEGVTDEFMKPIVMRGEDGKALTTITEGDVVIFMNFRNDRARELTTVLTQQDMPEKDMKTIPLHYLTMTPYDDTFKGMHVIFPKENVELTMGEVLAAEGRRQLRIAETEKYAHVTFFFSGGREKKFDGEERILIPSPKVATYDLKPEMSAYEVRDAVIAELRKQKHDFICLNFANGDMVGHTGVYGAIEKAVKTVDECAGDVQEAATQNGYEVLIISDHGNADYAVNGDGSPNTAHSLNPVPIYLVSERYKTVKNGILADVAPTILKMMDITTPPEMTGTSLV